MVVPTLRPGARPAAKAMAARGSSPGAVSTSDHHNESKPRAAASSTTARRSSPDITAVPVPTPMRTFTAPPDPRVAAGGHW